MDCFHAFWHFGFWAAIIGEASKKADFVAAPDQYTDRLVSTNHTTG